MRLDFLTPGTGGFHCGVCLRDASLVQALKRAGHTPRLIPMYLPLVNDADPQVGRAPLFFNGVAVYLRHRLPRLPRPPGWLRRILDSPALLRIAASRSSMTAGPALGALTVSLLRGDEGVQAEELTRLIGWMRSDGTPDAVCLATGLQIGLAREIRRALGVPVACSFQGEEAFLDSLPSPHREEAWALLAERVREIDLPVAPSAFYAERIRSRLGLAPGVVRVIFNGIDPDLYAPAVEPPDPPAIGFLARLSEEKGLPTLIDAFRILRADGRSPRTRLILAGAMTAADAPFVRAQMRKLEAYGLAREVELHPNIDLAAKRELYRRFSVFSVPALYGEAFGLYLLEAMAAAVPVVQPRHAAFPELLESTGAGLLCEPGDARALADALGRLLEDRALARELGRNGRSSVEGPFSLSAFARNFTGALREVGTRDSEPTP